MNISAVILTKNEEKNIERCLKSVDFCNEVIVVDDYSEDQTLEKIRNPKSFDSAQDKSEIRNKSKILIFKRKLNGDFAEQRNFGIEKAKYDWVLFVDADEEVTRELREEIKLVISKDTKLITDNRQPITVFRIKRRDFWWGRELKWGEIRKIRQRGLVRLIRKGSGKWEGKVHEEFRIKNSHFAKASRDRQKSNIKNLKNYLNHYPHPTVKEFLKEINFYSSLRARELYKQGKKTNIIEVIFYPLVKFLLTYFIYLGFLDGASGFAYAFFMSFHSFLLRAKLYQYTRINTNRKTNKHKLCF